MANPIIPLIMCGGAGTRLWPASRENRPKQFLPLFGSYSTFQETIRRVSDPALFGRPIIVTNGQYRFLVAEQLAAIGAQADILLEPMRREFGTGHRRGQRICPPADQGCHRGRAGCRSRRHRRGRLRQSLRCGRAGRRRQPDRHVRRTSDPRGDRIRLHSRRRRDRRRYFCHRAFRREAGRRDRPALSRRRVFVEFRQLFVPRRTAAR